MRAISLGFHDIVDDPKPGDSAVYLLYKLDRTNLRSHFTSVASRPGASVQTIDRRRSWGRETPVFMTFDDGALNSYTVIADELEKLNWRGHFFITTDWIGRPGYMNASQIRELHARGHVIGSHTCSHPEVMSSLAWADLVREWSDSVAILSDLLGERVRTASVAAGFYSKKVGRAAAASSIEVLFTSEATSAAWSIGNTLVLGRFVIQRHTTPEVSAALTAGDRWPQWKQALVWQAKKPLKAVTGDWYFSIRRFLLSRGVTL